MTGYYPASFFLGGIAAVIGSIMVIPTRNYRHKVEESNQGTVNNNENTSSTCAAGASSLSNDVFYIKL